MKKISKDRYNILEKINQGAMSKVYLGFDTEENVKVAIKVLSLPADKNYDEAFLRFKREAKIVSNLSYQYIIKLYDIVGDENEYSLVMEYFPGGNLKENINEFNIKEKIEIIKMCSEALTYIHHNNVIHRDIKPDNILVKKNKTIDLRIIDFGLAYLTNFTDVFKKGSVVGSFAYISPEQTGYLKREIDNRSDLYSLGATFYELVTGHPPFVEKDLGRLIHKHLSEKPVTPSKLNKEIPPVIDEIILKLLNKEPGERYQSADGLSSDLEHYLSNPEQTYFSIGLKDRAIKLNFQVKIVGRQRELGELKNRYKRVKNKRPNIVFIEGPTGIGKTKLANSFKEELINENNVFLSFRCSDSYKNIPYAPFQSMVAEYFNNYYKSEYHDKIYNFLKDDTYFLQNLFPAFLLRFLDVVYHDENFKNKNTKETVLNSVNNLFNILGSLDESIVLFIDDFQWADEGTYELIELMAEKLRNTKVMILIAIRDEYSHAEILRSIYNKSNICSYIDLDALEFEELPELVNRLFGYKITFDDLFYKMIFSNTLGNPFFILENIKFLHDKGAITEKDHGWDIRYEILQNFTFENDVHKVLLNRLANMNSRDIEILAFASVIGKDFDTHVLNKMCTRYRGSENLEEIIIALDNAKQEQLIDINVFEGAGSFYFVNEKICDHLYETLSNDEKDGLNKACAEILEEKYSDKLHSGTFRIAYHYNKTNDSDKKLKYNRMAYEEALSSHSLGNATYYAEKLMNLYLNMDDINKEKLQFVLDSCNFMHKTGKINLAFKYLDKALKITIDQSWNKLELETLMRLGTGHYWINNLGQAMKYYNEAIIMSEKYGIEIKDAKPFNLIGSSLFFNGDMKKAGEYLDKAIKYVQRDDVANVISAYGRRSWVRFSLGDAKAAMNDVNFIENAIKDIKNPIYLAEAYHYCSITYTYCNVDHEIALDYSLKSEKYAKETNNIMFEYSSKHAQAKAYNNLGEYDKAIEAVKKGIELSKKHNVVYGIDFYYGDQIEAYLNKLDFRRANNLAINLYQRKDFINILDPLVILYKARAIFYYLDNENEKCLEILDEAWEKGVKSTSPHYWIFILYFKSYVLKTMARLKESDMAYESALKILNKAPQFDFLLEQTYAFINQVEKVRSSKTHASSSTSSIKDTLQLRNIIKTSQIISSILDINQLLNVVIQEAIEVTGAQRGALLLLNDKTGEFEYRVMKNVSNRKKFKVSQNLINWVLKNKRGIIFTGEDSIQGIDTTKSIITENIRSIICSPLIYEDKFIGIIYLDSKLIDSLFSEEDMEILSIFSSQAAISIINAEKNAMIKKQFSDSINIIYSLMAKGSSRIYEATQEVSKICVQFAEKLALSAEDREDIRIAAILRDVSLLGLGERLLYGKISLSEEELKIIQTHPEKSAELIEDLEDIENIKEMILQHQERYNGIGYPKGLKGNEIVLGARIIGIVDDFVQLLRRRDLQFKDKKNRIIQEFEENKGVLYDPELVDVFIELINEKKLVYIIDEKDITENEKYSKTIWQIPSNINFEIILAERVMNKIKQRVDIDAETAFFMDYGLCEVIRNAIIHGNKYNENKKVTVTLEIVKTDKEKDKLIIVITDEGKGMDVREHIRFNQSRRELFSVIDELDYIKQKREDLNDDDDFIKALKHLNGFKLKYYTDFNTFRELEGTDVSGGVGLLQVMGFFDNAELKNKYTGDEISGLKVVLEKII